MITTFNLTNFPFPIAACSRGSGSEVVIAQVGKLASYTLSGPTQTTPSIQFTGGQGFLGMVSTDLVAVVEAGVSSLIDLSTSAIVAQVNSGYGLPFQKSQVVDGDKTSEIAFAACSNVGKILKATSSTIALVDFPLNQSLQADFIAAPFGPQYADGLPAICTVLCEGDGTNQWLFGTVDGTIIEVDNNLNVLNQFSIPREDKRFADTNGINILGINGKTTSQGSGNYYNFTSNTTSPVALSFAVTGLHYYAGWVVASCANGYLYLIHLATKKVLQRRKFCAKQTNFDVISATVPNGSYINNSAGPDYVYGFSQSAAISKEGGLSFLASPNFANFSGLNYAVEWDMLLTPMKQVSSSWTSVQGAIAVGFDETMGYAWSLGGGYTSAGRAASGDLAIFTYSGQRSVTNQNEGCPYGGSVAGETMIINDSSGVGGSKMMFHTPLPAGGQAVPVTSGLTTLLKAERRYAGTEIEDSLNRMTS